MGYYTGVPREWYCGIEGVMSIFMGAWNDPLIGYKGYAFNEPYYTDRLYDLFYEETGKDNVDDYAVWMEANSHLLIETLDEAIEEYEREEA